MEIAVNASKNVVIRRGREVSLMIAGKATQKVYSAVGVGEGTQLYYKIDSHMFLLSLTPYGGDASRALSVYKQSKAENSALCIKVPSRVAHALGMREGEKIANKFIFNPQFDEQTLIAIYSSRIAEAKDNVKFLLNVLEDEPDIVSLLRLLNQGDLLANTFINMLEDKKGREVFQQSFKEELMKQIVEYDLLSEQEG